MLFISCQELFLFYRYLHFCADFFDHVGKDKKAKLNFKVYDVTTSTTNNYNIHIANISKNKVN